MTESWDKSQSIQHLTDSCSCGNSTICRPVSSCEWIFQSVGDNIKFHRLCQIEISRIIKSLIHKKKKRVRRCDIQSSENLNQESKMKIKNENRKWKWEWKWKPFEVSVSNSLWVWQRVDGRVLPREDPRDPIVYYQNDH